MKTTIPFLLILILAACSNPEQSTNMEEAPAAPVKEKQVEETPKSSSLPNYPGMATMYIDSKDGLKMAINLWHKSQDGEVIVLCHQAGSSRNEYDEIAPKLNEMGYNCLALDQRSGGDRLGGDNITVKAATEKFPDQEIKFIDAEQDILAGIDYAYKLYGKPVILVGSSYSASLALKIGKENDKVKAVASFSPGEYYREIAPDFVQKATKGLNKPLFLTSSQAEAPAVKSFLDAAESSNKTQFVPIVEGIHGARALWASTEGNENYWKAFKTFLNSLK